MGTDFFSVSSVAVVVWDYPVSYLELVGAIFGLISVWLAARINILTWPTGLLSVALLGFLFYQVNLYADMALQVYFFVVSLMGWRNWRKPKADMPISTLTRQAKGLLAVVLVLTSSLVGLVVANAHELMPSLFQRAANYPFLDSFILMASVLATWLLAEKRVESWILWIAVDLCGIVLFYQKDLLVLCIEYGIFLAIATHGLYHWDRSLQNDERVHVR